MGNSSWTDSKTYYEENIARAKEHLADLRSRRHQTDGKDCSEVLLDENTENLARHYEQTIKRLTLLLKMIDARIANGDRIGAR
ncbi:hypothetical protein C8J38_10999 [Rhizobium sp. PP-WC-2G-219]|nr:hypothetical protein C8J38_10999 [Rhizobium sp. PP-WC-2G-219]